MIIEAKDVFFLSDVSQDFEADPVVLEERLRRRPILLGLTRFLMVNRLGSSWHLGKISRTCKNGWTSNRNQAGVTPRFFYFYF